MENDRVMFSKTVILSKKSGFSKVLASLYILKHLQCISWVPSDFNIPGEHFVKSRTRSEHFFLEKSSKMVGGRFQKFVTRNSPIGTKYSKFIKI